MSLTYENFPMLEFLSYGIENSSEVIPFEIQSEDANKFIEENYTLGELLTCIDILKSNGSGTRHNNYLLSAAFALKIKSDSTFYKKYSADFFSTNIMQCTGTICVEPGMQYIYMFLGQNETKKVRDLDGRLIAISLFKGNTFIGIEEGLISESEIKILPTGYYPKNEGLSPGSFITFLMVFLSYIDKKKDLPPVNSNLNKTFESVLLVE